MKIESFGASDIGLVRLNNEDVWAQLPEQQIFILADGMGGHKAGEVAANETVVSLCQFLKKMYKKTNSVEDCIKIFNKGVEQANDRILALAAKNREMEGMGTTLCLVQIIHNNILYAHIGDSRIYRLRKGRLTRLTRDHSLKDKLIATGELDESHSRNFPYKNVITRAIGTQKNVAAEIQSSTVELNDLYFLCSDGLTDALTDEQILSTIQSSSSTQEAVEELILEAKKAGGEDNITLLMLKVLET